MATIVTLKDKTRKLPIRAIIRRKGHPTLMQHFLTNAEAKQWASEQERSIRLTGLPLTIDQLKDVTVKDIVSRYVKEVTPDKGCSVSETLVLNKFLRKPFAAKSLAYVTKQDAYAYINDRLSDTWRGKRITPRTVRREVGSIQHVFEVAKEQWGYSNLTNPFRGVTIRGSTGGSRERRLKEGELARLEEACKRCLGLNRIYVPLAIGLAVETGMRLQEIFNLAWQDLDLDKRRIEITKSKTDHKSARKGRTIVMSFIANWLALSLLAQIKTPVKGSDRVFPMTKEAFKQAWADVKARAKISDLTFHDLRHEAGSAFDEAGLTKAENELMMGHRSGGTNSRYIHAELKSIQDKLDRHELGGRTLQEVMDGLKKQFAETGTIKIPDGAREMMQALAAKNAS